MRAVPISDATTRPGHRFLARELPALIPGIMSDLAGAD
jgi:hypothetical protein